MTYKSLKTHFHQDSDSSTRLYAQRITSESALRWDFNIGENPAFCLLTPELVTQSEQIFITERKIQEIWQALPPVATKGYLNKLLVNEIKATNDIEAVHSTRNEISAALQRKFWNEVTKNRFEEIARIYRELGSGTRPVPTTCEDIKNIFDTVTAGEIAEEDRIDDGLFRSDTTQIVSGTKVIHKAVPVEEIEPRIQIMLDILNDDDIPALIAAMVTHFMFEYIHPFFDGNGRTGRFLLAQKLYTVLLPPTVMALSPALFEKRNNYYKAFEETEHPLNKGDLTLFVATLLKILLQAQNAALTDLTARHDGYKKLNGSVDKRKTGNKVPDRHVDIQFLLGQAWLFSEERSIDLDILEKYFSETKATLRSDLETLCQKGLVVKRRSKPLAFALTSQACEELGLEAIE